MSETTTPSPAPVQSPPPAAMPQRAGVDETRQRLLQLASELIRTNNRRLLVEFLTLRRSMN